LLRKASNHLLGGYANRPADLDKLNDLDSSLAAFVFGDE